MKTLCGRNVPEGAKIDERSSIASDCAVCVVRAIECHDWYRWPTGSSRNYYTKWHAVRKDS